ncbi:M16 family metallopeptidase [Brevirhabdus sp.]|uniref:M16 family metallopeptidase n=1 Tax=Brevirhabdus sp. TaxID=2004514 RepID=UPI0040594212
MIRFAVALWLGLSLPFAAAAIEVQEVTSPGGIHAWLVQEKSIPFVALQIDFKGGASLDRPGKRGAISLMTALLEEGSGDMDARAFATATEELAASISFDVGDDALSVSARFLNENRDQAVALLRQALTDPRFDADAIERVRSQILSMISSNLKDPQSIASRVFNKQAYGDHPYGSNESGTLESVGALDRQDLVQAHRDVLARDNVVVGAAGDISAEELGKLLDNLLGDLPETGAPQPKDTEIAMKGGVTVVPFDTPQSVALFGQQGIARDDPDFFAAFVMNHILGGSGFESRLMTEVREKRGLTYGIGTYLVPKEHAALLLGQVASSNDRMARTVEVIREEWARMARDGVSAQELEDAKTFLTGAYPLRFDGNGRIADILAGMQLTGLPLSYIDTRNDMVNAVTQEDIKRVAKRLLNLDTLNFVIVGEPEGMKSIN